MECLSFSINLNYSSPPVTSRNGALPVLYVIINSTTFGAARTLCNYCLTPFFYSAVANSWVLLLQLWHPSARPVAMTTASTSFTTSTVITITTIMTATFITTITATLPSTTINALPYYYNFYYCYYYFSAATT